MSANARSIIVVGAGVFGVTAALELRRRGHTVSLFDPGPLPHPLAASTDISKAIRMDYGSDEMYMALMEMGLDGWDAWNRHWGEDLYHQSGCMYVRRGPMEPGSFEYESWTLLQRRGHHPIRLDSAALKARFPAWAAEHYPDGYFNPRGGWAESGNVVARLIGEAQAAGVEMHEGRRYARLLEHGSRVGGIITTGGERLTADYVIVAAGAWTPTLLPHLDDVMWATGQPVFHLRPANPDDYRPPRFCTWGADISRTGWYGFPANAGGIFKAANHGPGRKVHPDEPRIVTTEDEQALREFLAGTFAGLVDAPLVGTRLCLYCDTWDGDFWIDHDPEREGLVVAAGGSGHGFKFAPVLGGLIADALERVPNPYLARFAWRRRGEAKAEDARFTGDDS